MLGLDIAGGGGIMQPGMQALLSGALTMGVPLVFALGELVALRRGRPGGGHWRDQPPAPPPTPKLPPCLLVPPGIAPPPRRIEAPPRQLETVR